MKRTIAVIGALALVSCSTDFQAWQGQKTVLRGTGGTSEKVDGIDFWTYGSPPVPYRIIGVIQDERHNGIISRATLQPNIAAKARANGGDGVILVRSDSELRGIINSSSVSTSTSGSFNAYPAGYGLYGNYSGSSTSYGTGISTPVVQRSRTYLVIRYVHAAEGS